jgi:hypothetical protein
MTIPTNKKLKKRNDDQTEMKPLQEDGWRLSNTIQLSSDQAQQFLSFLEQQETSLERVIKAEESERRKILGQVYSLILSWGVEQGKSSASIKTKAIQETKSESLSAASLLNGIDLPGLGQIVEEKDLEKFLAEKQNRS